MTKISLNENSSLKGLDYFNEDFLPKMLDYLNFYPKEDRQRKLNDRIKHYKEVRAIYTLFLDNITNPILPSEGPDIKIVLRSKIKQVEVRRYDVWREHDIDDWNRYCDEKIKCLKALLKVSKE